MKKATFLLTAVINALALIGQPSDQQRIEDSVIGWEKIYNFKGKQYKPLIIEGQSFSPYQQSLRDTFITWVQRTYTPIAGIGTVFQQDFTSVQRHGPVPQGIGATLLVWNVAFDNTGKKLQKISETWAPIYVYANVLPGTNRIPILKGIGTYYFTMPKANYNSTFNDPEFIKLVKDYGLHDGDRFKKYMVYFDGLNVNVVLTPINKLPIKQVTKGEFLKVMEDAIPLIVAEEKINRVTDKTEQARVEAEFKPRWLKTINVLKEKYKNNLDEPAIIVEQNGPITSGLYNGDDFFVEGNPQTTRSFSIYKYESSAISESKKDKPLWISIGWHPRIPNSEVKSFLLHEAMLKNFNFEYVYDYFFNPDKVRGLVYAPLNVAAQQRNEYWATADKKLADGVFFADDFSSSAVGSKPAGWFSSSNRKPALIASLKDYTGKWVELGPYNAFTPATSMKKPLPENFTLEYDVVTDEFNARTGGSIQQQLSSYVIDANGVIKSGAEGVSISLKITSGNEKDYNNNNYSGGAELTIVRTSPSINNWKHSEALSYKYDLREFTNKKNKIRVTLKVSKGELAFFINGKQAAAPKDFLNEDGKNCTACTMPPGTKFRNLSFECQTNAWGPTWGDPTPPNVYISNVKITKE